MKILILGSARSKSNYFTASIAKYYNLDFIHEPYRFCYEDILEKNNNFDEFVNAVNGVTQMLNERDNFAMKLEVTHLIPKKHNKLLDLNMFNWGDFDKIYTTSRISLSDTIASLSIAQDLGKFLYTDDNRPLENITPREFKLELFNDRLSLHSTIRDREILKTTQNWLKQNNIDFVEVFYETMDDFIKNNLDNKVQDIWVKTNYDYKNIFTNYSDIEKLVESNKNQILSRYRFNLPNKNS